MTDFSKDYRKLFNEAIETSNTHRMQKVFEQLADEVGLPNTVGEAAQVARGKALAEMLNARAKGTAGGKKL